MIKIKEILRQNKLEVKTDEELQIPHIMYECKGIHPEITIAKNFIVEYKVLEEKYISPQNLEGSFYEFEKKFFSKYFFREDTDLKWNYYLIIIVEEDKDKIFDIGRLEDDDKFIRKLVMTVDEFKVYIDHGISEDTYKKGGISGINTYAQWQRELSTLGLDGILSYPFETNRVLKYIEENIPIRLSGRPIVNWDSADGGNEKYLVERIESLHIENFRNHCFEEDTCIELTGVNLLSGSNGSGKSSLCTAIEYAMTGEYADFLPDESTYVRIRNKNNEEVELKSGIKTREKKERDQLWYGTTTTARKSNLNRNFHTFNYLGLESSGQYMQELDINELVKNVLFGTEVTEAEKKMFRYKQEFEDRKKGYDKQIRNLNNKMNQKEIQKDGWDISRQEILQNLKRLGYRRNVEADDYDSFIKAALEIMFKAKNTFDILSLNCGEEESGGKILRQEENMVQKRKKYLYQQELRQKIANSQKKQNEYQNTLNKLHHRLMEVRELFLKGEGMENVFFNKQDFANLINRYNVINNKKTNLINWMEKYKDLLHLEDKAEDVVLQIEEVENSVNDLKNYINELTKQIELQKEQRDNLEVIMQEIHILAERYSRADTETKHCPMCGKQFSSNQKLVSALMQQKKYENADNVRLQTTIGQRISKKQSLELQSRKLQNLYEKKKLLQQKVQAFAELRKYMDIDEGMEGNDLLKDILSKIEEIRDWISSNSERFFYSQKVLDSSILVRYDGRTEWMSYLGSQIKILEGEEGNISRMLKTQIEQEKEQKKELVEEDSIFSEDNFESIRTKAQRYRELTNDWDIDEDMPVLKWIEEAGIFSQRLYYEQDNYIRQRDKAEPGYIEKLQEDKQELMEKSRKCKQAADFIGQQRQLKDVMEEFLKENEKQIGLFFKLLHRPKEFGCLRINDGKISFIRNSNGKLAESTQMSTGQRMALAFSVMITLHMKAPNAPRFLMLDEPVANLDDMHVLNLVDLLRELAIGGTQILITTADRQMAKFLRRKFSFFQGEYSHYELSRKGSERTSIRILRYRHDRKMTVKNELLISQTK